jgi:tetratricopeptide (TPR) repeat protein
MFCLLQLVAVLAGGFSIYLLLGAASKNDRLVLYFREDRMPMSDTLVKKILILAANPKGTPNLRLDEEVREIKEGLKLSKKGKHFVIEQREAVRLKDLRRAMLDVEPQIVHFSGHGAAENGLMLENEVGEVQLISTEALADLFELFKDQVECIILNACYADFQARAIVQNIDYVIGMKEAIGDDAAIVFSIGFYDALGAGRSVEDAYKFGCNAIMGRFSSQYLIPILHKQEDSMLEEHQMRHEFSLELQTLTARLKEVKKAIDDSGGIDQCSEDMLAEYLSLRREVSGLEQKSLRDASTPISLSGIPAPIQFIDRPEKRQLIEGPLRSTERWVRNIVIQGMGGTGKTVLAAEAARTVKGFFKKVIWASANDAPISLADLLDIVLRSLNYRSDQLTMSEKQAKVSELFQKDPYLLVVDSFERIGDKEVDRFLAEHVFYPSKVLITTRYIWPQASSVIALGGLTHQQTRQMMEEIGKSQGAKEKITESDIRTIYKTTGGLPLAISLIIGQLSQGIPLKLIISNLTLGSQPPGIVAEGMFENLFGSSWGLLSESARRILMSLTFFAAPGSAEAIQEINRIEKRVFEDEIENLIKMSLIQPNRDRRGGDEHRYSIHPLTRSFAINKIDSDALLKNAIYGQAVDYFIGLMEKLGEPGLELTKYDKLEQDLPNCLAAFEWCRNQRKAQNTSRIVDNLNFFLFERGYWTTRIQICSAASDLQHDSMFKDHEAAWRQAFFAGWVCSRQNNYEEAKQWLKRCEESLNKIPKENIFHVFYQAKILQLRALITHGEAVEEYKRAADERIIFELFDEANKYHDHARSLFKKYIKNNGSKWTFEEPDYAIAILDSNQGDVAVDMGRWKNAIGRKDEGLIHYEAAQHLYSKVLENARKNSWQNRDALIAGNAANLGHVEIWLEEKPIEEIRRRFNEALEIAESIGRIHTIAWCYRGYGLLEQRSAQNEPSSKKEMKLKDAQKWLEQALEIFERLGRRERVAETRESLEEVEVALAELRQ